MTNKEALLLLKKAGFQELNQVGSHRKFGKGVYRYTLVYHRSDKEILSKKIEKELLNTLKQVKNELSQDI